MALILCPECGHQVSDQAAICPNCGIKIAGNIPAGGYRPIKFGNDTETVTENASVVSTDENVGESVPTPQETIQSRTVATKPYDKVRTDEAKAEDEEPAYDSSTPLYGEPQKKNKSLIMMLSFIIALVVCIIAYWMWSNAANEKMEQQRYEEAMLSTNVQDLKDYLVQFNDAPQAHRDSVNARLSLLNQEDADWITALQSGSKSKLSDFIKTHPQSLHKGEAEDLIDSIDFSVAQRKGTSEAYAEYLKMHPDSKRASLAQDNLDNKKAKEVTAEEKSRARDVCKRFFQAINARNEQKLRSVVSDDAEQHAISFMNKMYKDDITNMNWHILDNFKVEKGVENADEPANLIARFSAEQNIERTNADLETYAKYSVSIEMTPDGMVKKFDVKKTN
ncbi:MAG: zinc-ribbon domain-containing protein [Prevotella sp.]|nr:zinc-ribbon domain-containing protein [Prevotella sp.]